jgi:hypothetical protein
MEEDSCQLIYRNLIKVPGHPKAHRGFVRDYILKAEKALGKYLPKKAVVHHHAIEQLVICENQRYHKLLHRRAEALLSCGHANWRKCWICKKYDDPNNLFISKGNKNRNREHAPFHRSCMNDRQRSLKNG